MVVEASAGRFPPGGLSKLQVEDDGEGGEGADLAGEGLHRLGCPDVSLNPSTPTVRLRIRAVSDPAAKRIPAKVTPAGRLAMTAPARTIDPTKLARKSGPIVGMWR